MATTGSARAPGIDAATLCANLRVTLETALLELIKRVNPDPTRIMLIDPPCHPNIGDSLILLGELDFLRRHYRRSAITFIDQYNQSPALFDQIEAADLVLIHGGGNFGDLWPHHHDLRKLVLERFSHKPTIQLPQTIHFDDPAERDATARIIARHSNFTLLVRDEASLAFARQHFACDTHLLPDMAFVANPLVRTAPQLDTLALLRTDKERACDHAAVIDALQQAGGTCAIVDWLEEPETLVQQLDRRMCRLIARFPALAQFPGLALREAAARSRVGTGAAMLSRGRQVVTDRLHGHIFCLLLGIPHFLIDTYGGKVAKYCRTWTAQCSGVTLLGNGADLERHLRESSANRLAAQAAHLDPHTPLPAAVLAAQGYAAKS